MNRQQKKKHEVDKMVIAKNVLKNIHHKSDSLIQVPVLCPIFFGLDMWICVIISVLGVFVVFGIFLPDWYSQPNQDLLFKSAACGIIGIKGILFSFYVLEEVSISKVFPSGYVHILLNHAVSRCNVFRNSVMFSLSEE